MEFNIIKNNLKKIFKRQFKKKLIKYYNYRKPEYIKWNYR